MTLRLSRECTTGVCDATSIFNIDLTSSKFGEKPRRPGEVKKVALEIEKGEAGRKPGAGRKAWVRTAEEIASNRLWGNGRSSIAATQKTVGVSRGTYVSLPVRDCGAEGMRPQRRGKLSEKNGTESAGFCEEPLKCVGDGSLELFSVFFADESLFESGK